MQLLFQAEATGRSVESVLEGPFTVAVEDETPEEPDEFARRLAVGCDAMRSQLDDVIASLSKNWTLSRMPSVDRNLLRLSIFEMLAVDEVALAVTIDESVEIAKAFGTDESSRFVNGLLGRVADQIEAGTDVIAVATDVMERRREQQRAEEAEAARAAQGAEEAKAAQEAQEAQESQGAEAADAAAEPETEDVPDSAETADVAEEAGEADLSEAPVAPAAEAGASEDAQTSEPVPETAPVTREDVDADEFAFDEDQAPQVTAVPDAESSADDEVAEETSAGEESR